MEDWIKYLIAFILGYLIFKMIRVDGFSIGGQPFCPPVELHDKGYNVSCPANGRGRRIKHVWSFGKRGTTVIEADKCRPNDCKPGFENINSQGLFGLCKLDPDDDTKAKYDHVICSKKKFKKEFTNPSADWLKTHMRENVDCGVVPGSDWTGFELDVITDLPQWND